MFFFQRVLFRHWQQWRILHIDRCVVLNLDDKKWIIYAWTTLGNFSVWALNKIENNIDFGRKIIFSDKALFHAGKYVNKQNCWIWDFENPFVVLKKPMHPKWVFSWCKFCSGGIIDPYFFQSWRWKQRYDDQSTLERQLMHSRMMQCAVSHQS